MILKRCLAYSVCYFFRQTSSGSNETWYPVSEDGLSLPNTLYGTGNILDIGYRDKKNKHAVSSLSWLSILFHRLSHLTWGLPGYFVVVVSLGV